MPDIRKTKIVPYTQEQMYDLVTDVESYPEFVPWCVSSHVINRTPEEVRGTLAFARGGLHKEFTTLNRLQPHKMIEIRLINGPFRHLEGFWRFETVASGHCRVSLDLEFEFSSRLVKLVFGPIFNQVANTLVDAFCNRAKIVYGSEE